VTTDTTQTTDDFTAAFAEFSAPEDKKEAQSAEGEKASDGATGETAAVDSGADAGAAASDAGSDDSAGAADSGATEAATSTEAGGETVEAAGAEGAEAAATETAATAQPEAKQPDVDDTLRRLAELVKEKPAAEEKPEVAEQKQPEQAPIYSEEEKAVLDAYDKEWPDIAKAEGLRRRAEYRELVEYVFQEVSKYLTPVKETVEALAERTVLTDLKTKVPDYNDTLRDQVIGWVDTQPAYLQTAYKQVIQQGTVEEVGDLIDRYRKATGVGASAPTSTTKVTELSSEAKQAAAALAPVSTKRTVVQQQEDPNDFGSAWDRFIDKV
jgi:hypothetical protein